MRMVTKRTEPGDMVSVQMRVDGFYELEIEFVNEMQIPVSVPGETFAPKGRAP